jgi:hypothetical protein
MKKVILKNGDDTYAVLQQVSDNPPVFEVLANPVKWETAVEEVKPRNIRDNCIAVKDGYDACGQRS